MKPRLDQARVSIETGKKQEDGLREPTEVNGSGKYLCRITEVNARIDWLRMGFKRQSTHGPRTKIEAVTSVEAGRRAEARRRAETQGRQRAQNADLAVQDETRTEASSASKVRELRQAKE